MKLKRKQQKELDSLTKKQSKEKHSIQKHQTSSIEKMIKQSANKLSANDDAVQSLVGDHADQWSALKEKHAKDYFKLLRYVRLGSLVYACTHARTHSLIRAREHASTFIYSDITRK